MGLEIEKNTVSAENQVSDNYLVKIVEKPNAKLKVMFIGNSITRHEPKEEIGWLNDWGMAASDISKDYVHVAVRLIEEKLRQPVNYCIVHLSNWEKNYWEDERLEKFAAAREYQADIVVFRIGENCWAVRDKLGTYELFPHFDTMARYFVSNPNANVIMTSLFWPFDPVDEVIEKTAAKNGYTYVKMNDLGRREDTRAVGQFWHTGVADHPNDYGMRLIAERIVEKV